MWRSIIINASQDDKRLSVKSSCIAFKASCNSHNSDSQQHYIS